MTRLIRSQNAHWNLRQKAAKSSKKRIGDIKYRYHEAVIKAQKAKQRVLTRKERSRIFKTVCGRV